MAIRKHRTKEQKRSAAARRLTYSLPAASVNPSQPLAQPGVTPLSRSSSTSMISDLYEIHPDLIKKDLLKTLVVSLVVLTIELGLYYYL